MNMVLRYLEEVPGDKMVRYLLCMQQGDLLTELLEKNGGKGMVCVFDN